VTKDEPTDFETTLTVSASSAGVVAVDGMFYGLAGATYGFTATSSAEGPVNVEPEEAALSDGGLQVRVWAGAKLRFGYSASDPGPIECQVSNNSGQEQESPDHFAELDGHN
jgi:hypothetical protein